MATDYTQWGHPRVIEYTRTVVLRGRSRDTAARYARVLHQMSVSTGRDPVSVPRDALWDWLAGFDPNAADFRLRHVRGWFRWLEDEGLRDDNPCRGLRVRKRDLPQLTATDEQVEVMLQRATSRRDAAVLALLVSTGMRRSECGLLRVDDVSEFIGSGVVRISASKTQTRVVPVDGRAEVALRRWLRDRPGTGPLWDVVDGPAMVAKTVRRCSDGSLTTHSLRRWFASTWLRDGGSETSLVRMCGWTSTAMVATYTRAVADEVTQAEYARLRTDRRRSAQSGKMEPW